MHPRPATAPSPLALLPGATGKRKERKWSWKSGKLGLSPNIATNFLCDPGPPFSHWHERRLVRRCCVHYQLSNANSPWMADRPHPSWPALTHLPAWQQKYVTRPFTHVTSSSIWQQLFLKSRQFYFQMLVFISMRKSNNNKVHGAVYYHLLFFVERIKSSKFWPF